MSGARSLKLNFLINLSSPLIRIAVALVSVPLYVHHVGNARYGVISLVWILLGYAGFLDLGMSRASVNALAKLRNAPQSERSRVLVTTLTVNFGLGLAAAVVGYAAAYVIFSHFMKVPDDLMPEIQKALPWIAGMVPVSFLLGAGFGAMESRERFGIVNILQSLNMTLGQILPVVVAITIGPSLAYIIPATAIASYFVVAITLVIVLRDEAPLRFSSFSFVRVKGLLSYGGWISVSNLLGILLVTVDQMMIGAVVGVASVAYYAVAGRFVIQSQIFSNTVARTLFPRMSHVSPAEASRLAARALVAIAYGYGAAIATAIVLTPTFFHFWLGDAFASVSGPLAQIMFVGALFNAFQVAPLHLLQAQGRPDIPSKMNAVEVFPFFGALWWATHHFGLTGAAVVWTLRNCFEAATMLWASKMPRSSVLSVVPAVALTFIAIVVAYAVGPSMSLALPAAAIIGVVSLAVAFSQCEDLRRIALAATARFTSFRSLRDPA